MERVYRILAVVGGVVLVGGVVGVWLFVPPSVTVVDDERFVGESIDESGVMWASVESSTDGVVNTSSYHVYNAEGNYTYFESVTRPEEYRGYSYYQYVEGGHVNGTWEYSRYAGNVSYVGSIVRPERVDGVARVNASYAVTFEGGSAVANPRSFQFGGLGRVGVELVGYERVGSVERNGTVLTVYEPRSGWYRFAESGGVRRVSDADGRLLYDNASGVVWNASLSYTLVNDVETRFGAYTADDAVRYEVRFRERRGVVNVSCPAFTDRVGPLPERCER